MKKKNPHKFKGRNSSLRLESHKFRREKKQKFSEIVVTNLQENNSEK